MVRFMMRAGVVVLIALLGFVASPRQSDAIYHLAVIDEVMSGFGGDPDVQFVEVRMLAIGQEFVTDTRLTVFNADGSSFTVLLLLPNDVANGGVDVSWLMATQAFADLTGLTPDFIFPPGILSPSGMVCWGAPDVPQPPANWDPQFAFFHTDCVAYGDYTGGNSQHPPPTDLPPGLGGLSLQRVQDPSVGGDLADFALANPSPTNNAGETANLPGLGGPTFTPTVAPTDTPGPTAPGPTATPEPAATATPVVDDDVSPVALPDTGGTGLDAPTSSADGYQIVAAATAVMVVGLMTLSGAAWYIRRRW